MSPPRPERARSSFPPGYWTIWTTVALDLVGFGVVAPILPRYAERFGASGTTVGLLFASFSLAQFVCAPLLGRLSDRIGRKPVIIISLFGTAVGSVLTGAAGTLWLLFLGRIVDGASGASVSVAQGAVSDLAPPGERARLMGLLGAAFGVGFVLGPALGGLASLAGPHVPFYVAAVVAAVNGLVAIKRLPETRRVAVETGPVDVEPGPAGTRSLVRLAVVAFVATAAFSGFESTFGLFGDRRFGLTEGSTAAVFVGVGLVLVAVQGGLIRPVTRRLGNVRTLRAGLAVVAVGLVVLAAATRWVVLVPALVLLAGGMGLASPTMTALVTDRAHQERRGAALGFQQSAGALARIGGPALAGFLFDHAGVPWPYLVGAVLVVAALGVLVSERTPSSPVQKLSPT